MSIAKIPYFYLMLHRRSTQKDLYVKIRGFARKNRKNATSAEDFFWEKVRDRRLFGLKINRQFIVACHISDDCIKYYIADFHCHEHKLIFELDGHIHLAQLEKDQIRTEHLSDYGYTVLRFPNHKILKHWDEVEREIWEFIQRENK